MDKLKLLEAQNIALPEEERYEHDCDRCEYVGSVAAPMREGGDSRQIDVYICRAGVETTLVMRHADEGPEYGSMPLTSLFTRNEFQIERYERVFQFLKDHVNVQFDLNENMEPLDLSEYQEWS